MSVRPVVPLLLAMATGCPAQPSNEYRRDPPAAGDPCISPAPSCADERTVLLCQDRVLTAFECAETCISTSAAYVDGECEPGSGCVCALEDPEGCDPSHSYCHGPNTVEICTDTQQHYDVPCSLVCGSQGGTCSEPTDLTAVCLCD